MATRGGYNSIVNTMSGDEIKVITGCKNNPSRDGLFCKECQNLTLKNDELVDLVSEKSKGRVKGNII